MNEVQYNLLQRLKRCFYKSSSDFDLDPETITYLTWDWQQRFLDETLNNTRLKNYPVSSKFIKIFLKKLMGYLENNQDIHDDFYTHLCNVMKENKDEFWYRHYVIGDSDVISIKETNKIVVNGTTGMRTWDAAFILADWALNNKEKLSNKTILELGSGVGFTGIAIAKYCSPQSIYLTDFHAEVLKIICDNVKINFPELKEDVGNNTEMLYTDNKHVIGVKSLDWNQCDDFPVQLRPDVLIGADIVYDPSILKPLCNVFKYFFQRNTKLEIYIASVIRNPGTFRLFLDTLDSMNFQWKKLPKIHFKYFEWDQNADTCLIKIYLTESYLFEVFAMNFISMILINQSPKVRQLNIIERK